FFVYGLPAGLALLAIALGALALTGLGGYLPSEFRVVALALYAVVVVPFAHLVLVNRRLRAVLIDARRSRRRDARAATGDAGAGNAVDLAAGIDRSDLDATLLCAARSGQIDLALAALD